MTTHSITLLCIYTFLVFLASLVGGWLPSIFRLTHARLQTAISFIAGLMLGMALLHLIPHAASEVKSVERATTWVLVGFLVMFFLQRVFQYHQHDAAEEASMKNPDHAACGHSNGVSVSNAPTSRRTLSWLAVAVGLGFHSLIDGLALAAAVVAESHTPIGLVALGTALAVIMHKPFDALAVLTLMHSSGCSPALRRTMNFGIALVAPLGVSLAFLGFGQKVEANQIVLGCALGFCGGSFLCIACSDLLPELHFHSHDRLRLSLALMAGLGISILVGNFEHSSHGHPVQTEIPMHLNH